MNDDDDFLPVRKNRPGYQSSMMTIREYAAIHLRVPDSGDPEIDAIIRRARRWELASLVYVQTWSGDAERAIKFADELIAAEGGDK